MPRIRLNMPEFEQRSDAFARIDTDVFSDLSGPRGLERCGLRPRIERWLECWSESGN